MQESPRRKKAPLLPVVIIPLRSSNPKLQSLKQPLRTEDTPGPNIMSASMNLFIARASWLTPYTDEVPTPTFIKTEKAEEKTHQNRQLSPTLWT